MKKAALLVRERKMLIFTLLFTVSMSVSRADHHRAVLQLIGDCLNDADSDQTNHLNCCDECQALQEVHGDDPYNDPAEVREKVARGVGSYVSKNGATQRVCVGAGQALAEAIANVHLEGADNTLEDDNGSGAEYTLVEQALNALPRGLARRWFCRGLVYKGVSYITSSLEAMQTASGYLVEQHMRSLEHALADPTCTKLNLAGLVRTYLKLAAGHDKLDVPAVAAVIDSQLANSVYTLRWVNEERTDVLLWKLMVSQPGDRVKDLADAMRVASEKHTNNGQIGDYQAWLQLVKDVVD